LDGKSQHTTRTSSLDDLSLLKTLHTNPNEFPATLAPKLAASNANLFAKLIKTVSYVDSQGICPKIVLVTQTMADRQLEDESVTGVGESITV
jgi:hypothetical protein